MTISDHLMIVSVAFLLAAGVLWAIDLWRRRKDARKRRCTQLIQTVLDD